MDFNGDTLQTDYYSSQDCELHLQWCYIHSSIWHILLPHSPPKQPSIIRAYDKYSKDEALLNAQNAAKGAKRGLWADPAPVPPWEWRARAKAK